MDKPEPAKQGLTRRAALLAAAKITGYVLTLPLPLVLVRVLDQTDFGLYKQVFQVVMTMLGLLGLHVSISAYYFIPRYPDKKAQVVMNVLLFYGAVGGAMALFFTFFPHVITSVFKTNDLVPFVPLIGAATLLWLLASLLEVVTIADGDVRSASTFTILIQLTKSALLIAAAVIFRSIHAVVIAALIQGALQCALLFWYLKKRYGHFWRAFDPQLFKAQLANAIPFGLGGLAFGVQADLHNYFVSYYFEPAMFAVYAIGCFEMPLLGMIQEAIVSVVLPEVARLEAKGDRAAIIALWATGVRKLAFFYVPTYTLLFVLREDILTLLFTKAYLSSSPIFAINLLLLPLQVSIYSALVRAFDDLKFFRLKLSLAMIPVTCALLFVGIHTFGLAGAIGGYVIAQLIDVTLIVSKVCRRLGATARDARRLAPVLRTMAASALAGVAAYSVKSSLGDMRPFIIIAVCAAVFGGVFLLVAFLLGAVTDDEKSELLRFYRLGTRRLGLSSASQAQ